MHPHERVPGGGYRSTKFETEWTRIRAMNTPDADEAWRWFTERYSALVRTLLARHVPSARADRAQSDFWAYLWQSRSIARADVQRGFRPFLFGIVRRYALAWLRDDQRSPQTDIDPEQIEWRDGSTDQDLYLWAIDALGSVLAQLRKRFPQDAWVIERFYGVSGNGDIPRQSVTEIASGMQKSLASVQQHLSRGRSRIRQILGNELRRTVANSAAHQAEVELLLMQLRKRMPDL